MRVNKSLAKRIEAIGKSLIENAESLAGTEDYINEVTIYANLELGEPSFDEISVEKKFYPCSGEEMVANMSRSNYSDEHTITVGSFPVKELKEDETNE